MDNWSKTPPILSGWYWVRNKFWRHPSPGRIDSNGNVVFNPFAIDQGTEWHQIAIPQPEQLDSCHFNYNTNCFVLTLDKE